MEAFGLSLNFFSSSIQDGFLSLFHLTPYSLYDNKAPYKKAKKNTKIYRYKSPTAMRDPSSSESPFWPLHRSHSYLCNPHMPVYALVKLGIFVRMAMEEGIHDEMETSDFKTDGEAVAPALGATYSVTQNLLDVRHQIQAGKLILLSSLFPQKTEGTILGVSSSYISKSIDSKNSWLKHGGEGKQVFPNINLQPCLNSNSERGREKWNNKSFKEFPMRNIPWG